MPLVSRTFDQLIDFTRTSAGGYYGPDGLYRMTPASKNLLTYTQEFDNAAWVKFNVTALPFDPAMATLGSEVVANGDFSSSASWTAPASGASITGGALTFDGVTAMTSGSVTANSVVTPIVIGRWYAVTFTIIGGTTNPVSVNLGGNVGTARSAAGTYTEYLFAIATTAVDVSARGATGIRTGSIDNISVKEVIGGLITAPDGTLTADLITENTATTSHQIRSIGATYTTGNAYTISVYAKNASGSRFLNIYPPLSASGNGFGSFNLIAGTAATTAGTGSASASITDVGNGWYRCSVSFVAQTTITPSTAAYFGLSDVISQAEDSYTGDGTSGIYLWGAQLEAASAASTYTRNFGGLFPPRFDYDPVTKAPRGLLVEEQRTNLLLRSEEFENASWVRGGVSTVTANAAVSPDGTADADKVIINNGINLGVGSGAGVRQDISKAASAITYTLSVYAKAAELNSVVLFLSNGGASASARATFNLAAGTVGSPTMIGAFSGASAMIYPAGNGWYRCCLTATSDTDTSMRDTFMPFDTVKTQGNGSDGIHLWGAQLEAGAFATSYIPTAASQVTRTADIATITGANFSQWFNAAAGTFVVDVSLNSAPAIATFSLYSASDNTTNERIFVGTGGGSGGNINTVVTDGGVLQAQTVNGSLASAGLHKYANAYALNDFASVANGSAAVTDTSGTLPTVDRLYIGAGAVGTAPINGHIRSIRYYPSRLTNAQLVSLTA
jgi:hypothetical protein